MNWTCLVYGGPMLGTIIWWIVDAHKWFKGPKASFSYSNFGEFKLICGDQVNIEHQMLRRDDNGVEGTRNGNQGSAGSSSESAEKLEEGVQDTGVR